MSSELRYTTVPQEAARRLARRGDHGRRAMLAAAGRGQAPVRPNTDGQIEQIGVAHVRHRFVDAPGDGGTLRWHLVEAGQGETIVFLHGLPQSWYLWHRQLAALSSTHRCLAIDLRGYGQSDKRPGDYRQSAVAAQLAALLDVLGVERFALVSHDRGTVQADHLAAAAPERIVGYVRGQQHLVHFHPSLAPQEALFKDPAGATIFGRPHELVAMAYESLCHVPIDAATYRRTIEEFSHPGIADAIPRYFAQSSFDEEWRDRRTQLMARWTFPVLVLQGRHDPRMPPAFYAGVERYLPDARVRLLDAGHFFPLERPLETTQAIRAFVAGPPLPRDAAPV